MDLFNGLVNEVLLSDVSTKGWREFETKYLPLAGRNDLFVQFTEFGDSIEDKRLVGAALSTDAEPPKSPYNPDKTKTLKRANPDLTLWTTPNHKDPTAIYTYPLEFVVHHPTSIPYGSSSRFLRVLKLRAGQHVLDLQTVTKEWALATLRKMGAIPQLMDAEDYWNFGMKIGASKFSPYPATAPKVFFLLAQSKVGQERWSNEPDLHILSNNDQRKRFMKVGIYVVQDTAKTRDSAVIHSNEPEQAFFMSPGSFDIIDVFETGKKDKINRYERYNYEHMTKKIGASVIKAIDPKDEIVKVVPISGGVGAFENPLPLTGTVMVDGPYVMLTKRGRAISVHGQNAKSLAADDAGHRHGSRFLQYNHKIDLYDETGVHSATIPQDEDLATGAHKIAVETRSRERKPEWKQARGVSEKSGVWYQLLRSLPVKADKEGSYVNIDKILDQSFHVCRGLKTLLSEVGMKWDIPTNDWEKIACWISATKIFMHMLQSRSSTFSRGMEELEKTVKQIRDGLRRPIGISKDEIMSLQGTKVGDAAKLIAAGHGMNKEWTPDSVRTVIDGIETCFRLRWPAMMEGAYPNYRDDISLRLPDLIESTSKQVFDRDMKQIWGEMYSRLHFSGTEHDRLQKVKADFYDRTGHHREEFTVESVNEVIIGRSFSVDTVNSGPGAAAPTVWRNPSKEAAFTAPRKQLNNTRNSRVSDAKRRVEKAVQRSLTWIRDGNTGSETAYIGDGRKVRIVLHDVSAGPRVITLRADRMPSDQQLKAMLTDSM